MAPDDLLWVVDGSNRRLSLYRVGPSSAQFVRTIPMPDFPSGQMNRVEWITTGEAVVLANFRDGSTGQIGLLRRSINKNGEVIHTDTVPRPSRDSLLEQVIPRKHVDKNQRGSGVSVISQPHGPRALRALGPGGTMALAMSSTYAVEVRDAAGKRSALLRLSVVGPTVSRAERQRGEQVLVAAAKANQISRRALRLAVPQNKPPLRALGYDLDGRLWVQRSVSDGKPNEADVYDTAGRWLSVMEWPADVDLSLWAVRGTEGLAVQFDPDGMPRPVKLTFR